MQVNRIICAKCLQINQGGLYFFTRIKIKMRGECERLVHGVWTLASYLARIIYYINLPEYTTMPKSFYTSCVRYNIQENCYFYCSVKCSQLRWGKPETIPFMKITNIYKKHPKIIFSF